MTLSLDELAASSDAGRRLAATWRLATVDAPHVDRQTDTEVGPTVHLEDVSEIPFVAGVPGITAYQHRARVRAGDGDLFVASTPPLPGYEDYCRTRLGLGAAELVLAEGIAGDPCAVAAAAARGAALDALCDAASAAGALTLHPYMAIAPVWSLAAAIEARTGVAARVLGPTPGVLWVANDKARLSEVVRASAGADALLELRVETSAEAIAAAARDLAARHRRVGLKRTRCASAMGNEVLLSRDILAASDDALLDMVQAFLTRTEWPDGEEILIVEWADTDLSPSTQMWIPAEGAPVCEGVYEQLLEGEEKCFLGSRPSTLPGAVNDRLRALSMQVSAALQAMGYVGRCSFDFLVIGDPSGGFEAKFVECNGRWGGTSTPMRLVDRVVPGPRPAYVAQDWMDPRLAGVSFDALCAALGDDLYDAARGTGRFILYNVGPLADRGKFDVVGLGESADDAWRSVRELLPKRLAPLLR